MFHISSPNYKSNLSVISKRAVSRMAGKGQQLGDGRPACLDTGKSDITLLPRLKSAMFYTAGGLNTLVADLQPSV